MLPISITSGDGIELSSNFNTMYFHVIGNPIAGTYSELWTRWNASDTTGEPAYDHVDVGPVVFSPVDATTISVVSQGTGETNIISFTNDNGTLSNFAVAFDPAQFDPSNSAYLGVTLTSGPFLLYADPVLSGISRYWTYNNSSGSARCILNEYQKL